jgi:hypothetical protein
MRCILGLFLLISMNGFSQSPWKDFFVNANGDTLNRVDQKDRKQGPWVHRYETVRGEPGYEEEGWYKHNRKEGEWKLFSLSGDLVGIENYKWGFKDGKCQYYSMHGDLRLEQSWKALNPDKEYDTIDVEDPDKLDNYRQVVIKNEGAAIKHGVWTYYSETGGVAKTETYTLGKLENAGTASATKPAGDKKVISKPKEVLDFEKKNSGKKKVKVKDGSTGGG